MGGGGGMGSQPMSYSCSHHVTWSPNKLWRFIFKYDIQHCLICRPSDSTVPTDAGIELGTVATAALAVRRPNHSARSYPPINAAVHITWQEAQINFRDLTPYLTYGNTEWDVWVGAWQGGVRSPGSWRGGALSPAATHRNGQAVERLDW